MATTDLNDKINVLIITPAVSIDPNCTNIQYSTGYIAHKLCLDTHGTKGTTVQGTENWSNTHIPLILHNDRTVTLQTLTKSSNTRHWSTLICSAINCFGIHFGLSTAVTSCCTNNNNKSTPQNIYFTDIR